MGDQSLVEIPIDKFDFDRNAIQFGGDVSITAVKPVIIIVHDKPFFALMMGPKSFGNKRADKNCERKAKGKELWLQHFFLSSWGLFRYLQSSLLK